MPRRGSGNSGNGGGAGGGRKRKKVYSDEQKRIILEGAKEDARQEFENKKTEVLASLPAKAKDLFGQVGFAKFGKQTYGVLVLSPFDVPPGQVREGWYEVYDKVRMT